MRTWAALAVALVGAGVASAFLPPVLHSQAVACSRCSTRQHQWQQRQLAAAAGEGEAGEAGEDAEASSEALATTEEFFSELKARGGSASSSEITDKKIYSELNKRRDFELEEQLFGELQVSV
jgi:hypothetical protein